MNNEITNLKKRLIYRSLYRGTKEMDKLVGSFVQTYIDNFNDTQLMELEKFLDIDDDTLYKIYTNKKIDNNYEKSEVILLFRNFDYNEK